MEEKELITSETDNDKLYLYSISLIIIGCGCTLGVLSIDGLDCFINGLFSGEAFLFLIGLIVLILGISVLVTGKNSKIIVTDKRVYGVAKFNARVDIPLDSVSSISTIDFVNGVSIASSSGFIKFWFIYNSKEIHKVMSDLLISRNSSINASIAPKNEMNNFEDIIKLKELLDKNLISQEEYEIKKKQILGL